MSNRLTIGVAIGAALLATAVVAAETGALQHPLWAYAVPPTAVPQTDPDKGEVFTLPGSSQHFTLSQVRGDIPSHQVGDWYPQDHPPMPQVVATGVEGVRLSACGFCHFPNGKGRSENAGLAGLPRGYIAEQLRDMRAGLRASAEPRKGNAVRMLAIAKGMTEPQIEDAAAYFSSMPWTPWIRVIESRTAPKVHNNGGLLLTLTGAEAGTEPLGDRIVETPVDGERSDLLRDPHDGFLAYVPIGSVARGKAIVTTGDGGRTLACATCHGADLSGVGTIPGIAGRSPSYLARQLNDFQRGTRHGAMAALMQPVVAKLTEADETAIVAYLASLSVAKPARAGS